MKPTLILRDNTVVPLSDDVYELLLSMVWSYEPLEDSALLDRVEGELASLSDSGGRGQAVLRRLAYPVPDYDLDPATIEAEDTDFLLPVL